MTSFFLPLTICLMALLSAEKASAQMLMSQQEPAWRGNSLRPTYEPICKIDETIGEKARGKKNTPAAPFYEGEILPTSHQIRFLLSGNWFAQDWERSLENLRRSAQENAETLSPVLIKRGHSWELLRPGEKASPYATSHYMDREGSALFAFEEKEQPEQQNKGTKK